MTLALGVAAISLLAIFALLPIGVKTNQIAIEQAASTNILTAVLADLRATPTTTPRGNATTSLQFSIAIPANPVAAAATSTLYFSSEGQSSATLGASSRYRLAITFLPNGTGARAATLVDLKLTWPAAAATNPAGSAEMFGAFDRN